MNVAGYALQRRTGKKRLLKGVPRDDDRVIFWAMGITSTTGAESFLSTSDPSRSEAQPSDSSISLSMGFSSMRGERSSHG